MEGMCIFYAQSTMTVILRTKSLQKFAVSRYVTIVVSQKPCPKDKLLWSVDTVL